MRSVECGGGWYQAERKDLTIKHKEKINLCSSSCRYLYLEEKTVKSMTDQVRFSLLNVVGKC